MGNHIPVQGDWEDPQIATREKIEEQLSGADKHDKNISYTVGPFK